MNKFIKLGKRILALFIVVLLNVNTYAAVGANDGSAFVTKAEFDALVNTFNEQMDTYQSGLNAKIDGAIANYLAGLSNTRTIQGLINLYSAYGFVNSVTNLGSETRLKTRRYGGISAYLSVGNTTVQTWRFGLNGGQPTIESKYYGDDDASLMYVGNEYMDGVYYATKCVSTVPTASGNWVRAVGNSPTGSAGGITSLSVTKEGEKVGTYNKNVSFGTVYGFNFANISGSVTWSFQDEDIQLDGLHFMSGSDVSGDDCYFVDQDEINDYGEIVESNPSGCHAIGGFGPSGTYSNYRVEVYHHKNTKLKMYDLIAYDASLINSTPIYYYSGLPLFKSDDDGRAKFKLKFTNEAQQITSVEISNGPFSNGDITPGVDKIPSANPSTSEWAFMPDKEYTIEFDVKKNTTYWIKARPVSGVSYIEMIGAVEMS